MKNKIVYIILFIIQSQILIAQDVFTVSGHIFDKKNGEYLVGATIYNQLTSNGTTTNEYGFFSISIPAGRCIIKCSFIGYTQKAIAMNIGKDSILNIGLDSRSIDLNEVLITKPANSYLKNNEFTFERITTKNIRQLPSVIGEPDLIKTLQLQSGVKTIGDGSSGMFIRGGSSDQNLIIIDEAPIYNPSHLFGLISVFNTDILNDIKFYKSNMPAQYGGRASAVIDCKMKEGNLKQEQLTFGISPFSANVSLNGPIIKDKSSYLFSLRKSYLDFFMNTGANLALLPAFYDLIVKVNTKLGEKNRLYFSVYNGLDKLKSVDGFYNKWGNKTATLRWNSILNSKLFSNFSFIYSNYDNYLEFKEEKRSYQWLTGVKDLNAKIDLSWYMKPEAVIKFGGGTIYHRFIPGETTDLTQSIPRIQAIETSAYILNDITFLKWLGVNYGLRLSVFQNVGKAEIFNYNGENEYVSTTMNQKGVYNTYWNLEPRVNINFRMKETLSLKLAYARNAQYMQVLQNNSLSYSSLETWFPANKNIKPLLADIFSLGVFQRIPSGFSISIETYYKNFKNQIDYVDHATLINNPYIESQTLIGKAKAYGVEFNFKK